MARVHVRGKSHAKQRHYRDHHSQRCAPARDCQSKGVRYARHLLPLHNHVCPSLVKIRFTFRLSQSRKRQMTETMKSRSTPIAKIANSHLHDETTTRTPRRVTSQSPLRSHHQVQQQRHSCFFSISWVSIISPTRIQRHPGWCHRPVGRDLLRLLPIEYTTSSIMQLINYSEERHVTR